MSPPCGSWQVAPYAFISAGWFFQCWWDLGQAENITAGTSFGPLDSANILGFDGLFALVRTRLQADPLSGHLFIFRNRAADRLKVLYWDADGYALWYKRLEEGTFKLPRIEQGTRSVQLRASELAMMLDGIDLKSVKRGKRYKRKKD